MWKASGLNISMAEGDFGIALPVKVNGAEFGAGDEMRMKIAKGTAEILSKVFTTITHNTVDLVLTEAESEQLPIGIYTYSLDWYHDGVFMCNIIPISTFKVEDKV